jgi:hypothetical protein
MTLKEAKNTTIFYLQSIGSYKARTIEGKNGKIINLSLQFVVEDYEIKEGNLYDFIMESMDKTTSPRGVESRLHIKESEDKYQVWTWGLAGNNPQLIEEFDTLEEAEESIFQKIYQFDFMADDQRDTQYFIHRKDAEIERGERLNG